VTIGRTLTPQAVVAAALRVADDAGMRAVTLTRVARELGCHVTSLYTHVASLDDLHARMLLTVQHAVADRLWEAALGRARDEALRELARVYRAYAAEHPVRVRLLMASPPVDGPGGDEGARRLAEPVRAALRSYGLGDEQVVHAHRAFSSIIRGFLIGEIHGLYASGGADATFEAVVDLVVLGLETGRWPDGGSSVAGAPAAPSPAPRRRARS
jgi:AcrR family transcriptional regulator